MLLIRSVCLSIHYHCVKTAIAAEAKRKGQGALPIGALLTVAVQQWYHWTSSAT
jgi:hypothetical protein